MKELLDGVDWEKQGKVDWAGQDRVDWVVPESVIMLTGTKESCRRMEAGIMDKLESDIFWAA